jgi:hypothetical protein
MRRYAQNGGALMAKLLLVGIAAIAASSPKLSALFGVFGQEPVQNGGQTGGGFAREKVINGLTKLGELYGQDVSLPQETRDRINAMIPRLTDKIKTAPENTQEVQPLDLKQINNEVAQTTETVSPSDDNSSLLEKLKTTFVKKVDVYKTKVNTLLENKIQSIKLKFSLDDNDVNDIKFLKNVVIDDVLNKKDNLFENIRKNTTFMTEMTLAMSAAAKEKAAAAAAALKEKFKDMPSWMIPDWVKKQLAKLGGRRTLKNKKI